MSKNIFDHIKYMKGPKFTRPNPKKDARKRAEMVVEKLAPILGAIVDTEKKISLAIKQKDPDRVVRLADRLMKLQAEKNRIDSKRIFFKAPTENLS